jgi:hypothetical protein
LIEEKKVENCRKCCGKLFLFFALATVVQENALEKRLRQSTKFNYSSLAIKPLDHAFISINSLEKKNLNSPAEEYNKIEFFLLLRRLDMEKQKHQQQQQ